MYDNIIYWYFSAFGSHFTHCSPLQICTQLEIAAELDRLSAKLDDVDKMISSAMADDPQVKSILSSTADVWMPVITANANERREFAGASSENNLQDKDPQSN
jgi:hypothetical protein